MEVILEPKVYLKGYTTFVDTPEFPLPAEDREYTDGEKLAAFAAKACYDSFGENGRSIAANQQQIMSSAHGSVLSHIYYSFYITGISRALSLELNRHGSILNISQLSTRYVDEKDGNMVLAPWEADIWREYEFQWLEKAGIPDGRYIPKEREYRFIDATNKFLTWNKPTSERDIARSMYLYKSINAFIASVKTYTDGVFTLSSMAPEGLNKTDSRKWARDIARGRLPHNLETKGVWTGNIRGWRWVLESRSERHATAEIRVLANKLYPVLKELSPLHFEDFTEVSVDGIDELVPKYRKI